MLSFIIIIQGLLTPLHSLTIPCYPLIKINYSDVSYALAGLNPRKTHGTDEILLRNCTSVLAPCLAKVFQLCLSAFTFPSCWKFPYIQLLPEIGDRYYLFNYSAVVFILKFVPLVRVVTKHMRIS